jgi:hypothetical protein
MLPSQIHDRQFLISALGIGRNLSFSVSVVNLNCSG